MKRLFMSLFLLLPLMLPMATAQAQDAASLRAAQQAVNASLQRLQSIKPQMANIMNQPGVMAEQQNEGERKFIEEILPHIDQLLFDAGRLFGEAAEQWPLPSGDRRLAEGCNKLDRALALVKRGKRLLRREGVLGRYLEDLNMIKTEVISAQQSVKCYVAHTPWNDRKFDSEYVVNGRRVKSKLHIHGDRGTYKILGAQGSNGHGQFNEINFSNDGRTAEGNWSAQGQEGWFSFTLSHDNRSFQGSWGFGRIPGNQRQGSWNSL